MKIKIIFFIIFFTFLATTTSSHAYSESDLRKMKDLAAICSIGPSITTLLIGTEDQGDLLIASCMANIAYKIFNASVEDYDLTFHVKNILAALSKLQNDEIFSNLLDFDLSNENATKKVEKTLCNSLIKEFSIYIREKLLKKIFPPGSRQLSKRATRIFITIFFNGLMGYCINSDLHSVIPTVIAEGTYEICGEFIMHGCDREKFPTLAELFGSPKFGNSEDESPTKKE